MTDRRLYLRRWLLAFNRYEQQLRVKIATQRNAFIRKAAKDYERIGNVSNHLRVDHEIKIKDILLAHYQAVMPKFGALAVDGFKSRFGRFEYKAATAARQTFHIRLLEWATTRALNYASSIADTDMEAVRVAITDGLDDGLGTAEIGRSIRKVTESTVWSAARIARTETHTAATFGAIEEARQAEQDIGIKLVKEWVPTRDDRTRPSHAEMANYGAVPLDERFEVGGESMDRPGDPSASPENTINCRCAIITEEAQE